MLIRRQIGQACEQQHPELHQKPLKVQFFFDSDERLVEHVHLVSFSAAAFFHIFPRPMFAPTATELEVIEAGWSHYLAFLVIKLFEEAVLGQFLLFLVSVVERVIVVLGLRDGTDLHSMLIVMERCFSSLLIFLALLRVFVVTD